MEKVELQHIKNLNYFEQNPVIIDNLLSSQKTIEDKMYRKEIQLGEDNEDYAIILVVGCFCKHCYNAVDEVLSLWERFQNIKIKIRFSNQSENEQLSKKVALHITKIYNSGFVDMAISSLKDWYLVKHKNEKSYIYWTKKFPVDFSNNDATLVNMIDLQNEWLINNGLDYTPVILINNKVLPPYVNLNTLYYLLKHNERNKT